MWKEVIYLRYEKRRPVRRMPYGLEEDLQAAVPYGWCPVCGMELYGQKQEICELCERWERDALEGITGTLPEMYACD